MQAVKTIYPVSRLADLVPVLLWAGLAVLLAAAIAFSGPGSPITGLQVMICALTLFVGAIVASFSRRYMRADSRQAPFFATLAALLASVLAVVLAGNLPVLAIAWLASGLLLARLVGHADGWAEAQASARRIRRTFLLGDGALLLALALLGLNAQSTDITRVLAAVPALHALEVTVIALLMLVAAAARCALPPFSGWLLSSMTAPTPVSALMHAGLVNAGGFLLLRFAPVLEAAPLARYAALAIGLLAALWGLAIMAVRPDIKRSLAGSTVSQMGFMIMSCGLGAYTAALWHIVAHGLFKAWLFLGAGSALGMRDGRDTLMAGSRTVGLVAALCLLAGSYLAFGTGMNGELLPLMLAIATAAATLVMAVARASALKARLVLLAAVAALLGFHVLGYALVHILQPGEAAPLLPPFAILLLLACFLASWWWQALRMERGNSLPPALYVRLLNAGALAPATVGESR